MGRGSLPPGFRFHPTDVELVRYYLKRKVSGKKLHFDAIAEIDIYKYAPWDLPHKSLLRSGDLKWYFFCPREKKYASGGRMNRATSFGFWKTTGKDRCVYYKDEVAGMIKTLVFHTGKAPKGDRTDWVMYEYRLEDKELSDIKDSYVLSVVFKKEGPGPRNGAQYVAPFNEEEWDDDDNDNDEEVAANVLESLSFVGGFTPPAVLPVNQNIPITTSSHVPVSVCKESSMSAPSKKLPPLNSPLNIDSDNDASSNASLLVNGGDDGSYAGTYGPPSFYPITQCNPSGIRSSSSYPSEMLPPVAESLRLFSNNDVPCAKDSQALPEDDELFSMLDAFSDEHNMIENASDQKLGGNFDGDSWLEDVDFFNGLGQFTVEGTSNCYNPNDAMEKMLQSGDGQYLELSDLDTPLSFPMEATEQVLSGGLYVENNSQHPANPYHATQLVTGLGQSPMLTEDFYRYQDQMNAFSKEKANYGYDVPEASLCQDSAVTRLSQDMGSACPFDATGDMFGGMQNGFSYMRNLHR